MRPSRLLLALLALCLFGSVAEARPKPVHRSDPGQTAQHPGEVEVLWGGTWWAATVIERRHTFSKVHYTGWSASYDAWVEADRVRTKPIRQAVHTTKTRAPVEILWGGKWWPGKILNVAPRSRLVRISYDGYGAEWHQWVEPEQVRGPGAQQLIGMSPVKPRGLPEDHRRRSP